MLGIRRIARGWWNVSDEQRIERIRRSVESFDRWRRPLTAFCVVLAIGFLGLLVAFVRLLDDLGRNLGMRGWEPGFVIGLALGTSLGVSALKIGHMLATLFVGFHNERLLIHYYDAFREMDEAAEEEMEDEP